MTRKSTETEMPQCSLCKEFGPVTSVDLGNGESLPPEIEQFDQLLVSHFGYSILRCPQCQRTLLREQIIDNENVSAFACEELHEISAKRAQQLIQFEATMMSLHFQSNNHD